MAATEETVWIAREDSSACRYTKSLEQLSHSYWEPATSMRFACESKRYRSSWQPVLCAYGVNYNWSMGEGLGHPDPEARAVYSAGKCGGDLVREYELHVILFLYR
jgi:hypothetical protein